MTKTFTTYWKIASNPEYANYVYIGQSEDDSGRMYRNANPSLLEEVVFADGYSIRDAVSGLSLDESLALEKEWLAEARELGFNIVNPKPEGGRGRPAGMKNGEAVGYRTFYFHPGSVQVINRGTTYKYTNALEGRTINFTYKVQGEAIHTDAHLFYLNARYALEVARLIGLNHDETHQFFADVAAVSLWD